MSRAPRKGASNPLADMIATVAAHGEALVAIISRFAVLEAQVASLQMAAPKGLGHAAKRKGRER